MHMTPIRTYRALSSALVAVSLGWVMTPAGAVVVDITAGPGGTGCTSCYGGPTVLGSGPGQVVTLVNDSGLPNQLTLDAGAYSITNAAPTGFYSAWRYDGGGSDWAWNFVIGSDNGNNTATVLEVGWVGGLGNGDQNYVAGATNVPTMHFQSTIDPNGSTAGFYDTFTLASTTTLDFFVVDGYLPDNTGGLALDIEPLSASAPSVPEPASWAMMIGGFGMIGGVMRSRKSASLNYG